MAEDTEVLRGMWNGGISIGFQLSADEVFIPEEPVPVYTMAPRLSYLPLVMTDRIHKYFQRFIDPESSLENVWLEDTNGNPVKWHWPIGVLYDLEFLSDTHHLNTPVKTNWLLTVHYKNFPEGEIVKFSCREAVESFIMSGIKEADFLKHRGVVVNNLLQKNDFKKLFQGLTSEKFDLFWSVNRKLMETKSEEHFRFIPFRIHDQNGSIIQKLLPARDKSGQENTLLDLFRLAMPSLLTTSSSDKSNTGPLPISSSNEATNSCDTEPNEAKASLKFRFLIQGISVPLETPIQWLSEHFSHPDNFLHICIAPFPEYS